MTQLSAPHPFITSKSVVLPLEALGLPGEQSYMSLVQMINLPSLLFKPLGIEQTLKFLAQSSKIHISKTLVEIQEPLWCDLGGSWIPHCRN